MTRLTEIRRGVADPVGTAGFFGWLLGVEPERLGELFRLRCANGSLVIHGDVSVPIAIRLAQAEVTHQGEDPDGVPVAVTPTAGEAASDTSVRLDHVRLNCEDLKAAAGFYTPLGFTITWSGLGDEEVNGAQDEPIEGATWLHLSCDDGYLSLSQADWKDYGSHSAASGPPRFIHIGLEVRDLAEVVESLDRRGVSYLRGSPAVGTNVYLNDPDGQSLRGTNIELIEYSPGAERSGRPRHKDVL